jgi:TRAP-type C4-dicarboxylate transport system permease small subunit
MQPAQDKHPAAVPDRPEAAAGIAGWLHRCVAYGLIPLIVVMVSAEVLARYVFRSPLRWSEEIVTLSLLLTFVGAIPYCVARDAHVKVETLYERFGAGGRRVADAIGSACGAAFMGMLALGSGREMLGMMKRGDATEHAGILHWPLAGLVCAIAAYTALWLLSRALTSLRGDKRSAA